MISREKSLTILVNFYTTIVGFSVSIILIDNSFMLNLSGQFATVFYLNNIK